MDGCSLRGLIGLAFVGTLGITVYPLSAGLLWHLIVLGIVLGSAIAALIMCLTLQLLCYFRPAYSQVLKASCLGFLAALLVIAGTALIIPNDPMFLYLVYGAAFLTDGLILGYMIQNPATGPIGILKGLLLTFIQFVTLAGAVLLLCLVVR
jgi:hypothetical protein